MRRIALVTLLMSSSACARPASEEAAVSEPAEQAVQETRPGADAGAHTAVIASVQTVLDAINGSSPDLLRGVMLPDARIVATGRGPASSSTVEEMARRLAEPDQRFVERIWSPEVAIDGPIASVWAPYDLIYTVRQPPACGMHPDGPPR
jgi:hypothetical protein